MTVAVVEFENGYPIEINQDPRDVISQSITSEQATWYELNEGDHDITPSWWTKNLHRHKLAVFGNGNALFRAIPKDQDVGVLDKKPGQTNFTPKKGGIQVRLPEDQSIAIVAGPTKDLKGVGVHRVVLVMPGPNPSSKRKVEPWLKR